VKTVLKTEQHIKNYSKNHWCISFKQHTRMLIINYPIKSIKMKKM